VGVNYLIDTHILLWWLFNDPKLNAECQDIIRNPDNRILVSIVATQAQWLLSKVKSKHPNRSVEWCNQQVIDRLTT
jgi:PIN domain nuclease of toxin-antitoxin system